MVVTPEAMSEKVAQLPLALLDYSLWELGLAQEKAFPIWEGQVIPWLPLEEFSLLCSSCGLSLSSLNQALQGPFPI